MTLSATLFRLPEFAERDGLEQFLYWFRNICVVLLLAQPFITGIVMWGGFVIAEIFLTFFSHLTGYTIYTHLFIFMSGSYTLTINAVLIDCLVLYLLIGANFTYRSLKLLDKADFGPQERQLQLMYRAHQIWFTFSNEWSGIAKVIILACCLAITMLTGAIKFYHEIYLLFTVEFIIISLTTLVILKIALQFGAGLAVSSVAHIKIRRYHAKLSKRIVDEKFYRSCRPLQWAVVGLPVDKMFIMLLMDNLVVGRVVDLLLLFE